VRTSPHIEWPVVLNSVLGIQYLEESLHTVPAAA
jgi:hypothetical protein